MNCLEFRRHILINPEDDFVDLSSHRAECPACAKFAFETRRQDELIREASRVDVPDQFAARILLNQTLKSPSRRPMRRYWLGLAASVLLATLFVPGMFQDTSADALEIDLVAHAEAHNVLSRGYPVHVTETLEIEKVLATAGAAMPANTLNVIYGATCVIEGKVMAHLLIEKDLQRYVVFLMPEERVLDRDFKMASWAGRLKQIDRGGIAVLSRDYVNLAAATGSISRQFSFH